MANDETAAHVRDAVESIERFRTRVKELLHVPASGLVPHPSNPRIHNERQRAHVDALLRQVGFATALLTYRGEGDKLYLIDGHLRADLADDDVVPVLVTDLTPAEADLMLAAMDQVAGMAELNDAAMTGLLGSIEHSNADVRRLLDDLSTLVDANAGDGGEQQGDGGDGCEHRVDELMLRPHEHYDYVVVLASDVGTWNALCEALGIKQGPLFGRKKSRFGICRAVRAEEVLQRVSHRNAEQG